jgi:hypothetical protein
MKNKKLHRLQVDSVGNILGRLKDLRKSYRYHPGYLVDRNNITRAIIELEDLLDRYKEVE